MRYESVVDISKEKFDRINRLLSLPSLSEMSDTALRAEKANTNQCEGVFCAKFADGSWVDFDLCSGSENYYDDVVWHSGNGDITLDCSYELDDIEFEIDGNEYYIKLNIETTAT